MGGTFNLENHGHGGSYLTAEQDIDYYTPKCITADGNMNIERGQFHLLATGDGGKGIDCSDTLFIGRKEDDFIPADSLLIDIETQGTALVDNVEEDFRKGCPKAIKADKDIKIYSGNLNIVTKGQGGEGIECKNSLRTYKCTIIANCYDDGINTGERCQINGSHVFCRSINNDGIDSNGKFTINDGIVAAISEHFLDESFDTEGGCLYIYGGLVIGIGNDEAEIGAQTTIPFYSTRRDYGEWGFFQRDHIVLDKDSYLSISNGEDAIISLYHGAAYVDAYVTIASSLMQQGSEYLLVNGKLPTSPHTLLFDGRVVIGGFVLEEKQILRIRTK